MTSTRIVVVHGPVGPDLAITLTKAGLTVLAAGPDTTIYGSPANTPPPQAAPTPATEPALLTIHEAADRLGVGRSTVYRLIETGELEVVHVGRSVRVPPAAIDDLVDRLRRRPRRSASTDRRCSALASSSEEPFSPLVPPAPVPVQA